MLGNKFDELWKKKFFKLLTSGAIKINHVDILLKTKMCSY